MHGVHHRLVAAELTDERRTDDSPADMDGGADGRRTVRTRLQRIALSAADEDAGSRGSPGAR
jgi:hypothetical protein